MLSVNKVRPLSNNGSNMRVTRLVVSEDQDPLCHHQCTFWTAGSTQNWTRIFYKIWTHIMNVLYVYMQWKQDNLPLNFVKTSKKNVVAWSTQRRFIWKMRDDWSGFFQLINLTSLKFIVFKMWEPRDEMEPFSSHCLVIYWTFSTPVFTPVQLNRQFSDLGHKDY
jgi:hypothetical protein